MTSRKIFLAVGLLAAFHAAADMAGVSDVVVHSRWPWEAKIDISCVVGTDGKDYDFDVTATWDGQATPVSVDTFVGCGVHATVWDPAAAGLTNAPVANFRVAFTRVPVSSRTYMFVDLANKTVTYSQAYAKTSDHLDNVIPFRRVRAGTYTNGYESALLGKSLDYGANGLKTLASRGRTPLRQVTLTSDYYISIYKITRRQWRRFDNAQEDNTNVASMHYYLLRGAEADGVDWPFTGFTVASGSTIGACREHLHGALPRAFVLDLPTAAQWEVAMRAGEDGSHFWSLPQTLIDEGLNPGDASATLADMTNTLNRIAIWGGNQAEHESDGSRWRPGEMEPNAWNIYDAVGLGKYEWVLDRNSTNKGGVDPVGEYRTNSNGNRKILGNGYSSTMLECVRGEYIGGMAETGYGSNLTSADFRLVINTRNWME